MGLCPTLRRRIDLRWCVRAQGGTDQFFWVARPAVGRTGSLAPRKSYATSIPRPKNRQTFSLRSGVPPTPRMGRHLPFARKSISIRRERRGGQPRHQRRGWLAPRASTSVLAIPARLFYLVGHAIGEAVPVHNPKVVGQHEWLREIVHRPSCVRPECERRRVDAGLGGSAWSRGSRPGSRPAGRGSQGSSRSPA